MRRREQSYLIGGLLLWDGCGQQPPPGFPNEPLAAGRHKCKEGTMQDPKGPVVHGASRPDVEGSGSSDAGAEPPGGVRRAHISGQYDEPSWGAVTSNVEDRLDRLLSEVDSIRNVTRRGDKNAAFLAWRKRAEAAVTDKLETTSD